MKKIILLGAGLLLSLSGCIGEVSEDSDSDEPVDTAESALTAYGPKYNSKATCDAVDSYMHGIPGLHHCAWFNFPGVDDDGYYRTCL